MNINEVIKHPILSEKSYQQMSSGIYTFAVDFRTNKSEVKKVIEHIFEVKVIKVNIMQVRKKEKNVGRFKGFTNRYKKAIVTLKEGETINIFPNEEQQVDNEKINIQKEVKENDKKEISDVEKRAAEKIAAKLEEKNKVQIKPKEKVEVKPESKIEKK